ncbi:MAG: penicillin-binding transpeptidase domain-containing protein, partial [Clostridia bacterium]
MLGFVSVDNVGQTGLEAYYNKYLTGINGKLLTQSDLIGKELSGEPMEYIPATDGLDVVLTIDYVIQSYVEQALDVIMQAYSPKNAKCLVIDVTNGDVLAMCVKPSVNLNNIDRSDVGLLMELSRNSLVTDIYEPGSTFKVVTTAATLEESLKGNKKAFDENYVFRNNSRTRIINGSKISCWSTHANGKHANQTISQALNNSCNPIFTDIALSLGAETFYEYLEKFGYGKPTGIDFSGEQSGILISKNSVTAGDLARIGFGQSVTVTAIQLAMATSAAVNGGLLYQPRLVKAIVDKSTKLVAKDFEPTVTNRAISVETSKKIAKMLQGVVTDGSGKKAYIQGYEVGGKTGTAQKFENGKLAEGKYVSSFVTFFPASSPKYLALILVDEPEGASYGSVVAAPF